MRGWTGETIFRENVYHEINMYDFCSEKENSLPWVRSCISLYRRVHEHMGFLHLFLFAQLQLMWIEALFLAMSLPINSKTEFLPMIIHCLGKHRDSQNSNVIVDSAGFLLISMAFLIFLKMMCFEIDAFYRSFKNIRFFRLKNKKLTLEDQADIEEVMDIIDDAQPISGCGLFEINRSTLTNMISTSVTYLIILLQFKLSF